MSASADAAWVPYAQRPEWADVVRIPQDDGPSPPVAIHYTDKCKFASAPPPAGSTAVTFGLAAYDTSRQPSHLQTGTL